MTASDVNCPAKVIVIIPAFNEVGKIGKAVASIPKSDVDKILVVDDGSSDSTAQEAQEQGAVILRNESRKGVGAAIRSGYRHALDNGYDIAVVMAGNSKDDGREIQLLTSPIKTGNFDLIQGSRYLKKSDRGDMPLYRIIATKFVHPILFSLFCGQRMTDTTNGFRAIRTSILKDPRLQLNQSWLDKYELENYLLFMTIRYKYRVTELTVHKVYPERKRGFTKMRPIVDWWKMLRPIFLLGLGLKK